jgi:hypothetical protein
MCVAASGPVQEKMGVNWPTKHANPILDHPPELVNSFQTLSFEALPGDITHINTRTATNPPRWIARMRPSMGGRIL